MNQGAYSIKMNFKWKDLGWGNQRGQIWIQLMRNGKVLADTREDYFALAPHMNRGGNRGRQSFIQFKFALEDREVVIRGHPVVDLLERGDRLRFMRNVGGGGGDSLTVRHFKVQVELKKY